jgi:hypothetical protein
MQRSVAMLSLLLACGGRVVDAQPIGDAQTTDAPGDAADAGEGDGWCGLAGSHHSDVNDVCEWSNTWSVGGTEYTVDCTCPVGHCTCAEQNGTTSTSTSVNGPAICPPCYLCGDYTGATLSNVCGFPDP